jgi:DNA modification methylase
VRPILIEGDAREVLRTLRPGTVDLALTHPPTYGWRGEHGPKVTWANFEDGPVRLGQELHPSMYAYHLGQVLREVKRLVTPGGLLVLITEDNRRQVQLDGSTQPGLWLNAIPERIIDELRNQGWGLYDRGYWLEVGLLHDILVFARVTSGITLMDPPFGGHVFDIHQTAGKAGDKFFPLPRRLIEKIIAVTCPAAEVVLDPFAGTGTVAKVAWELGRTGIGIEIDPEQVAVFNKWYAEVTKEISSD